MLPSKNIFVKKNEFFVNIKRIDFSLIQSSVEDAVNS